MEPGPAYIVALASLTIAIVWFCFWYSKKR